MDKKNMRNVSDYVAELCNQFSINKIHGLMGGGASGLNDGFICNQSIEYLCYHHEQSAGYAALAEARLNKKWAVLNPTTGCGGTNAYTPVLNAWQDSIPLVIISGNVNIDTCSSYINKNNDFDIRCFGVQENDIEKCIKPITKYSNTLFDINNLEQVFFEAFSHSMKGRMGPVWVDLPADIQHLKLNEKIFNDIPKLVEKVFSEINKNNPIDITLLNTIGDKLSKASRPLVLIGGGVRNNKKNVDTVKKFIEHSKLPVVTTYASTDVISHEYDKYLGAIGVKGNRAANFFVQNCDCLLVLGCRLAFGAIGYDIENFAKYAEILVVDNDNNELDKNEILFPNRLTQINANIWQIFEINFFQEMNMKDSWVEKSTKIKKIWNIIEENKSVYQYNEISIYNIMDELQNTKYDNSSFVIDAGSISYVAPTALHYNYSRDFIFSPAQADMGCALPSSLGVASASKKPVYCITGDGSFMSNMQELATLAYNCYDIKIILLNNGGYLSISNTQNNNYGANRVFGEHEGRGLKFPCYETLCRAFGIKYKIIENLEDLKYLNIQGPILFDVRCLKTETIAPYQARINGKQAGAHDMAPHRNVQELQSYQSVDLKYIR